MSGCCCVPQWGLLIASKLPTGMGVMFGLLPGMMPFKGGFERLASLQDQPVDDRFVLLHVGEGDSAHGLVAKRHLSNN